MSNRKSQGGKLTGIYQRGNIFWYGRMVSGKRIQVSLETSDWAEAVAKALEIRADPFLVSADPLRAEIDSFIDHKVRQNEYSPASAESKRYALKEFVSFVKKADPSTITPADVERDSTKSCGHALPSQLLRATSPRCAVFQPTVGGA